MMEPNRGFVRGGKERSKEISTEVGDKLYSSDQAE